MDSLSQQIFNICLIYARHCINTGETMVRSDIVLVNQVHQLLQREKNMEQNRCISSGLGEGRKVAIREVPQNDDV